MTAPDPNEAMREAVRNALREMLPDVVGQAGTNGDAQTAGGAQNTGGAQTTGGAQNIGGAQTTGVAQTNGRARTNGRAQTNGHGTPRSEREPDVIPMVPAPPVAAVLRPSTWNGPAVPGEVIGSGSPGVPAAPAAPGGAIAKAQAAPAPRPAHAARAAPGAPPTPARRTPPGASVETVTLDSDEDLQAFVRSLVTRLESPRDRLAIKAGRLQFRLQRSAAPAGAAPANAVPAVHVPRGAVTERQVRQAHSEGTRLVLARSAVLTPLARETARTLGVQIERETQC